MKNCFLLALAVIACFTGKLGAQQLQVSVNKRIASEVLGTDETYQFSYVLKNKSLTQAVGVWAGIVLPAGIKAEVSLDSAFGLLAYGKYPVGTVAPEKEVKVYVRIHTEKADSCVFKFWASCNSGKVIDSSLAYEIVAPVPEISVFNVQTEENRNTIRWSLINPELVERYELVRTDVEGHISILFTEKNMYSCNNVMPSFEYVDMAPYMGKSYYHVRLTLKSGEVVFSESIEIIRQKDFAVTLFGKSLNEVVRLSWLKKGWENAIVSLHDKDGETVVSQKLNSKNYITVNTQEIKAGTYQVKVKNKEKQYGTPISIKL